MAIAIVLFMTTAKIYSVPSESSASSNSFDLQNFDSQSAQIQNLLATTPGIATLTALVHIDPYKLSPSSRIDFLSALERQTAWLQAIMQRAIVAVAGNESSSTDKIWDGVDEAEREDIATALRLSPNTAQMRIDVARTLVNHLPNTCSALAMGEISTAHATVIAKETAAAIRTARSTSKEEP